MIKRFLTATMRQFRVSELELQQDVSQKTVPAANLKPAVQENVPALYAAKRKTALYDMFRSAA